jgi:drug/metabolite transporter (DMT)-like permease
MTAHAPSRALLFVVLTAALLGVSASAVIVKGMVAPALAVAAWRTLGASVLLGPAWVPTLHRLERRDRWGVLLAGAALGAHFAVWFASLQLTTVMRSTLLVCTTPVWAGLLDVLITRTLPSPRFVGGLLIAIVGVAAMAESGGGQASALGDGLALSGAVLAAIYLRASQSVRERVGAGATMGTVCAVAAGLLWIVCLGSGTTMGGYPAVTWALLAAAVLGPQLIGHQGFTWAMGWVPASTVALVVLLEPVGATVLAALIFREVPHPQAGIGALVALLGVGIAVWKRA